MHETRRVVLDGLNYACASPHYLRHALNGARRDYVTAWYLPLLDRGFAVPFFVVLDFGLLFCEGAAAGECRFRFSSRTNRSFLSEESSELCHRYYAVLAGLSRKGSGACDLIEAAAWDARRAAAYANPWDRGEAAAAKTMFDAAPLFLEGSLRQIDRTADWWCPLDPDELRALASSDQDWENAARRMEEGNDVLSLDGKARGGVEANLQFFRSWLGASPPSPVPPPAEGVILRAACAGSGTPPLLDLALLSRYMAHHTLRLDDSTGIARQRLARLAHTGVRTSTTQPSSGYEGLSNRGPWSGIVRSQLAVLGKSPGLFAHRAANGKLFFYSRLGNTTRPLQVLLVLVADGEATPAGWSDDKEYLNTATREIAACLAEDVTRCFADAAGVEVSIYFAIETGCADADGVLLRVGTEQRARVKKGEALLTGEADVVSRFFRLLSPACCSQDRKGSADVLKPLAERLVADRKWMEPDESAEMTVDCLHLVRIARTAGPAGEDSYRELPVPARANRIKRHVFACSSTGIRWFRESPRRVGAEQRGEVLYSEFRAGKLRREFCAFVVAEAVRALETA